MWLKRSSIEIRNNFDVLFRSSLILWLFVMIQVVTFLYLCRKMEVGYERFESVDVCCL